MKKFTNSGQFKAKDVANIKFGHLTALYKTKQHKCGAFYWKCRCDCGNESEVLIGHLTTGSVKTCGCSHFRKGQNKTHGLRKHSLYPIWRGIKSRCYNVNMPNYHLYGGRGISMCDEWRNDFKKFYDDMIEGYVKGMHIDRIDNDGDYTKVNCRWVTPFDNQSNKRTNVFICMDGRTHTPAQWGRILDVKDNTIANRKRKGWDDFEALFGINKHVV